MLGVTIVVQMWISLGAGFLALRAGFQNIDRSMYEAGAIEGIRNRWQELIYIVIPSMGPQLMFAAVMQIVSSFTAGTVAQNLVGFPSTDYKAHTIMTHAFDYGWQRFEMGERAQLAIDSIKLLNPKGLPTYSEYLDSAESSQAIEETPSALFRIEGENARYKSDPTLYPTFDNSSYLASPADPRKMVYNTLGSGSWKKALQTVTWEIPEEEIGSGGWYKIGIKARQDQIRGFDSNRRVYIDGEVPCQELDRVEFAYDTDWAVVTPKSGSEDIYVWLEGGMSHTISLEAVTGDIGEYLRQLDSIVRELNTYYRKVLMITGPSPDKYTDYYVHEKIPELVDRFSCISAELKDVQSGIESLTESKGTEAAALENMAVILDKCIKKPMRIPSYLSQIKDSITSLSAWGVIGVFDHFGCSRLHDISHNKEYCKDEYQRYDHLLVYELRELFF